MRHSLVVVDDFLPNPEEFRAKALAAECKTREGPDGGVYTGIGEVDCEALYPLVATALQVKGIRPHLGVLRSNPSGEIAQSKIHSDRCCGSWAGILYLNLPEQCQGGTAFWRHREHGFRDNPKEEDIVAAGLEPKAFYEWMLSQWNKPEVWDQIGFVGMQFNRFIAYPSSKFHSRWPFEGFGTGDGRRLIWVTFFDLVD